MIYEYSSEIWSTPYSLIKEMEDRGISVKRFHLTKMSKEDELNIFYFEPDITLVMDWKGIDISNHVKNVLRNKRCFLIRENGDTPQNYERHLAVSDGYHLLLTPDHQSMLKYNEAGYNCVQFQHFADTRIHYPKTEEEIYPIVSIKEPPVRSTRGPGGSRFLDYLSQVMPGKFWNKNGMTGREYGLFLASAKIVVQNSRWQEVTRRVFEGMACGSLVLTDRLPEHTRINDLFIEDQDIVYYDDINSCISKINYYLYNWKERNRIAENSRQKTLQNHTQVQRVDLIINEYNKWRSSQS